MEPKPGPSHLGRAFRPGGQDIPVMCGGALLRPYDDKETRMVPLLRETKSLGKALEKYNRY